MKKSYELFLITKSSCRKHLTSVQESQKWSIFNKSRNSMVVPQLANRSALQLPEIYSFAIFKFTMSKPQCFNTREYGKGPSVNISLHRLYCRHLRVSRELHHSVETFSKNLNGVVNEHNISFRNKCPKTHIVASYS